MSVTRINYLADEPLTFEDVAAQCRIDGDAERVFIESTLIPAARQLAEQKTGAVIRLAHYQETFPGFPSTLRLPLSRGPVREITEVRYPLMRLDTGLWDRTAYRLVRGERAAWVEPVNDCWPMTAYGDHTVHIEYHAGIDLTHHPAVKQWLLLACAWLFEQRELYVVGPAQAMPQAFADTLLADLTVAPRF